MLKFVRSVGAQIACVLAVACASEMTCGQQTLPPESDATAGTLINSIPIGNYSGTLQVIYGSDLTNSIPVGSVITGMQMRLSKPLSNTFPNAGMSITRYDITMGTSIVTPETMLSTFASNIVSPVVVRSGSFNLDAGAYQWVSSGDGVPEPWGPVIPFTTPYTYTDGPLVIEYRVVSPAGRGIAFADIANPETSQRYMLTENNPDATAAGYGPVAGGPIVRLFFDRPVLSKGTTKVIVGKDYARTFAEIGDSALIMTSAYTQQQVAAANQFATIGPGSDFVGMAWRQYPTMKSMWPAAAATFSQYDVQFSRSLKTPGALSTTIASNVGPDAVMVRSGPLALPIADFGVMGTEATAPFSAEINFTNPYTYRSGPLLSVIRHSGQSSGTAILLDAMDDGTTVQASQNQGASATVAPNTSHYPVTRYSVDAGTMSPLNMPSPPQLGDSAAIITPLYQIVLSASELQYIPVGSVINSLWLRQTWSGGPGPSATVTSTNFELALSSAVYQPAAMRITAAANEGPDKVLVHVGPLTVPAGVMPASSTGNFGKIVQFQRGFVYKGGPLCITIRHTGLSSFLGSPDILKSTTANNRWISSNSVGATTGTSLGSGLAIKLGYVPSVMTPNRLEAANGTDGSSGWYMPGNTAYAVQVVIPADQLRSVDVGSAITGMSLRQASANSARSFPMSDMVVPRFDVTMAPAVFTPPGISTTYANNIGAGAVTVRSGAMTVPAGAFPYSGSPTVPSENTWYVPFSRAYVYTGGDLCVTIRGQGAFGPGGSQIDGDGTTPNAQGASLWSYDTADAVTGTSWGPLALRLAFTPQAFCPWDLNNDGIVEDSDFTIFVNAYNTLDCTDSVMPAGCPADFNYDRVVDDVDFQAFVIAYNNLLCPS